MPEQIPDPRELLPEASLLKLWDACARHDDARTLRASLACRLAFEVGATGPEILALRVADVDREGAALIELGAGTSGARRLPTTPALRSALRLFDLWRRQELGTPAGLLVGAKKQALYRDVRHVFELAQVPMPPRPLAVLREHALLRKAAEGCNLAELSAWAGIIPHAFLGGRRPHLAPFRAQAAAPSPVPA